MSDLTLEEYLYGYDSPSQADFIHSTHFQTLYAGGVGSGKTHALIKRAIMLSFLEPGNEGLLARYTAKELETTTKPQFFEECPESMILEVNKSEDYVLIKTGQAKLPSKIWFRHIWEPKPDKKHLSGMNLGWIGGDQIEDWEEARWNDIMARFRRQSVRRPYMFGIINPKGHDWCWKRWIKPAEGRRAVHTVQVPSVTGGYIDSKRYYAGTGLYAIVAKTEENFFNGRCADHLKTVIGCEACRVAAAGYVERLRRHNPRHWVNRMVDSSFDEWAGKVYPEYDEYSVHNIDDFEIPADWPTIVPIDCGGDSPWAIPVIRVDHVGDLYVTREFHKPSVLVSEIARWIKDPAASRIPNFRDARKIIDPENKLAMIELADHKIYCEAALKTDKLTGIYLVAGYMHRVPGRLKVIPGQRLEDGSTGPLLVRDAPRLWVFRSCENWRREHSAWRWKRDPRTEGSEDGGTTDEPVDADDHQCDATIYAVRIRPPVYELPEVDPELEALKRLDPASYREALHRDALAGRGKQKQDGTGEMFYDYADGVAVGEEEDPW